jgi:hypothetical protein
VECFGSSCFGKFTNCHCEIVSKLLDFLLLLKFFFCWASSFLLNGFCVHVHSICVSSNLLRKNLNHAYQYLSIVCQMPKIKLVVCFATKKGMGVVTSLFMLLGEVAQIRITFLSTWIIKITLFTVLTKAIATLLPIHNDLIGISMASNKYVTS